MSKRRSQNRAPPSFLISEGVFTQLEVFVSKFPSFCNSRYCSSVKRSMPLAAAISIALSSGLCSFLVSRASYLLLRCALPHAFFSTCLCVLIDSQLPRRSQCTGQYILARRQANMRV